MYKNKLKVKEGKIEIHRKPPYIFSAVRLMRWMKTHTLRKGYICRHMGISILYTYAKHIKLLVSHRPEWTACRWCKFGIIAIMRVIKFVYCIVGNDDDTDSPSNDHIFTFVVRWSLAYIECFQFPVSVIPVCMHMVNLLGWCMS